MRRSPRFEDVLTEAHYRRHRYDLYRAKMYGPRPTTMTRLRELERAYQGAGAACAKPSKARAARPRLIAHHRRPMPAATNSPRLDLAGKYGSPSTAGDALLDDAAEVCVTLIQAPATRRSDWPATAVAALIGQRVFSKTSR
jgi:hypothetical protein